MPAIRTLKPADNVISFAAKAGGRLHPPASDDIPSDANKAAEIYSLSNNLAMHPHPTVPPVQHSKQEDDKRETGKARDEQHSIEEMAYLVPSLTDKELKARFPKAWNEHQTVRKKCKRKSSRDKLHPGFATFRDFLTAMGPAPSPSHTVDRINRTNPVYGPTYCRWEDPEGQASNRSTNKPLTWMGIRRTMAQWAKLSGIKYRTLQSRENRGKTLEEMFADAPVRKYRTPAASGEVVEIEQPAAPAVTASAATVAPPVSTPTDECVTMTAEDAALAGLVRRMPPPLVAPSTAPIPSFDADGWPVTLRTARDFETGWNHAREQALKNGHRPISKAHFGAWVTGSHIVNLQQTITAGGASPALHDRLAYLQPINQAFVAAHLDEVEAKASRYVEPADASRSAHDALRNLIKANPQYNVHDVWKVYRPKKNEWD